jgi:hypothetical protein
VSAFSVSRGVQADRGMNGPDHCKMVNTGRECTGVMLSNEPIGQGIDGS